MAATLRNIIKARAALLFLALLGAPAQGAPLPALVPDALAVIYDEGDEFDMVEFSRIIAGIEDTPHLKVYRIALNTGQVDVADAGAAAPRRPVQLAYGGQGGIAVIYPDIGEPYRSVFSRIIEGIEDQARTRVASYAVGAGQSAQDIGAELKRQNIRVVIALGRNGLKAAAGLDRDIGVVVGGVLSVPESEARGMSVFSLAPDPHLIFGRLKALKPGTRRVFVVYDPRQNGWLIRLAREAARSHDLELIAHEATDLKSALLLYQEVLASADASRDALWLPQDSVTAEESAVLPLVLRESWDRALAVFSSNVAHVKRGALFSLYPNNVELGRNLASSALDRASPGISQAGRAILPLKEVLMAVNVRTAGHLGLNIGQQQQRSFDTVFPER